MGKVGSKHSPESIEKMRQSQRARLAGVTRVVRSVRLKRPTYAELEALLRGADAAYSEYSAAVKIDIEAAEARAERLLSLLRTTVEVLGMIAAIADKADKAGWSDVHLTAAVGRRARTVHSAIQAELQGPT